MARGWGRSEEDLPGDKEQARSEREPGDGRASGRPELLRRRRPIELSLARVREELAKTSSLRRRRALEMAERDLGERLQALEPRDP